MTMTTFSSASFAFFYKLSDSSSNIIKHFQDNQITATSRYFFKKSCRLDSGDDGRVSKEEFLSENVKESVETWVGPIEDMEAEFEKIDKNGGGQILFSEFVDWALEKNLDIEDDIDED